MKIFSNNNLQNVHKDNTITNKKMSLWYLKKIYILNRLTNTNANACYQQY